MRARASKDGLTLRVIAGSNNALLAMDLSESKRHGCLGFTIERTDLDTGARRWLPNLLRFPCDELDPSELKIVNPPKKPKGKTKAKAGKEKAPDMEVPSVSSARAPLQKFRWGDYTLDPGKRYCYRVIARYGSAVEIVAAGKEVEQRHAFDKIEGGVTVEIKTENNSAKDAGVFFNRAAAASRAYNARYGNNDPEEIPDALWWLSRGLEEAIVAFIGRAVDSTFAVHAAIYEFQKPDLLQALVRATKRGVDVKAVYHGRVKPKPKKKKENPDKTAKKNEDAIATAKITFAKARAADPQGAIMHNKFVVLLQKGADGTQMPVAVWTGSTNWTDGAIYGQLNVGHAIFDPGVAAAFEKYFQLLHADSNAAVIKKGTVALCPVPKNAAAVKQGMTPIFSPQSKLDMIELYADICRKAKVLMVSAPFALHPTILATFNKRAPGTVRFLMADKAASFGKNGAVKLLANDPGNTVAIATTVASPLHDFQGALLEDTESFHHAGVHIHSKIIAADPFSEDPILVTGSANFSNNSTRSNDENSVVVRGDTLVMDIYATEFMRMFEHYWFRAHLEGKTKGSQAKVKGADQKAKITRIMGLKEDSSWTDPYYKKGDQKMLERLVFAGRTDT
jgi:phosphatidylserine/phosphatidylglycerophosphate/cardiolipin synthase-like enzyme